MNKNKKISQETAKSMIKPWDDAISHSEEQINKDLMQIFRNIFVEYKYFATRQLKRGALWKLNYGKNQKTAQ